VGLEVVDKKLGIGGAKTPHVFRRGSEPAVFAFSS